MNRNVDEQWMQIMENDPLFTDEAVIQLESGPFTIRGFYASGTYGQRKETGYTRQKTVRGDSFSCSTLSLGELTKEDLMRRTLTVDEGSFQIFNVLGGASGITVMELAPRRKADGQSA